MKKITTLFILILTLALGTVAFSACVPGVSGESDMYGSFFLSGSDTLPDGSRCVTLKENNVGIVEMIGNSEQPYYADYDFVANTVELHVDDIDTLRLDYSFEDENGDVADSGTMTFVRDRSYDPEQA